MEGGNRECRINGKGDFIYCNQCTWVTTLHTDIINVHAGVRACVRACGRAVVWACACMVLVNIKVII